VAALAAGCASVAVPPIGAAGRSFEPAIEERALWTKAAKEAETFARGSNIYREAALDADLAGVATRLVPPEARAAGLPPIRVSVLRDPAVNAFALPDGTIYVSTGLLARLDGEAQLATILAREIAHVTHRHAFRASSHAPGGAPPPPPVPGEAQHAFLGRGLPISHQAAVEGFGRTLDREADRVAMERLAAAGYDPHEAPRAFERLAPVPGDAPWAFFLGRRDRLDDRVATTRAWLRSHSGPIGDRPVLRPDAFAPRLRGAVRENALLDARAGRFQLARAQLDRVLALTPGDPVAHVYSGDIMRMEAQHGAGGAGRQELIDRARAEYERAAALDPRYPDPFRQLGLLYYQDKDYPRAREAFERYLALGPDAPDARRIKEYLIELAR
jgi:beta-barrel assembly-enhancing protease